MSMTDEEFRDYILSAQPLSEIDALGDIEGYEAFGRLAAKMTYEHLSEFPEDNQLDEGALYDRVKETHPDFGALGLTGFMWGYAMQSAEKLLNLTIKPNPALWTIAVPE